MMRITYALVLVLLAVAGATAQSQTKDAAVAKALSDYDNAWNRKDVTRVSQMLAPDYVYFSSTGGLTDRKATLEFLGRSDYKLSFVERTEVKILSRSAQVAVVSSRWKGKGTFGNETIDDDQRCGLVFVRRGNGWNLLSEHCAQIVTK